MPVYTLAAPDDRRLLEEVAADFHPHLADAGVTVGLLLAVPKEGQEGPALKLHGYPALAVVKVNSLKDRVEGKPDCTVQLDGEAWKDLPDARRRAVLDHELTHVVVQRDADGRVKTDDAGRPKLKLRLHDMQVGGFEEVVKRHGAAAVEADHYAGLHRRMTQLELFAVG